MKFDTIRLIGLTTIDLKLQGAKSAPAYKIKSFDGLGTSFKSTYGFSNKQGSTYRGRAPSPIVLNFVLALSPRYRLGETVESLRDDLYGLASSGYSEEISIQFLLDSAVVGVLKGSVDTIDPALMEQKPVVSLVINCDSPYILGPEPIDVTGNLDPANGYLDVFNVGSSSTGFELSLRVTSTSGMAGFSLYNLDSAALTADQDCIKLTTAFQNGDILNINTSPGSKKLELKRGSQTVDLLGAMTKDSSWIALHQGMNHLLVSSSQNPAVFEYIYFKYMPKYWGV